MCSSSPKEVIAAHVFSGVTIAIQRPVSPSMVTAPEGDYIPAGAMSSMENSTDLHP